MKRIAILWMMSFVALADEAPIATADATAPVSGLPTLPATQDPVAMTSLWQLTLGMLVVLGLIVSIAWVLKRTGRFQMAAGGGLRVLGGLSMGSRERVVLIQAGETQLLLGVAPGRVQTLHVLDQPLQMSSPTGGGFAEQLSHMLKKDKPE
ncbi:flagellar biosynthetic protein FliO [Pseudomonadota bacterium]